MRVEHHPVQGRRLVALESVALVVGDIPASTSFKDQVDETLQESGKLREGPSRKALSLLETQYAKIEKHIKSVKFEIPTNELYEIYDSCNYNTENEFCPVLLKLGK